MKSDIIEERGNGMIKNSKKKGEKEERRRKKKKKNEKKKKARRYEYNENERNKIKKENEDIMGKRKRKVIKKVAAGRNLAVLVEAAVRNYVLQLRGMDSTKNFLDRHEQEMENKKTK